MGPPKCRVVRVTIGVLGSCGSLSGVSHEGAVPASTRSSILLWRARIEDETAPTAEGLARCYL